MRRPQPRELIGPRPAEEVAGIHQAERARGVFPAVAFLDRVDALIKAERLVIHRIAEDRQPQPGTGFAAAGFVEVRPDPERMAEAADAYGQVILGPPR